MTSYTFMLSLPEGGSVRICQYDKRNKLKAEFTSNEPFFTVDVAKKVTRMELIGTSTVKKGSLEVNSAFNLLRLSY